MISASYGMVGYMLAHHVHLLPPLTLVIGHPHKLPLCGIAIESIGISYDERFTGHIAG